MLPRRFVADKSGATAVEYGLLCALLAVAISAVISASARAWLPSMSSSWH